MIQSATTSLNPSLYYRFDNQTRADARKPDSPEDKTRTGEDNPRVDGEDKTRAREDKTRTEKASRSGQLTPEQQRQVESLKQRDQEVRQHEQTHMAVGGNLVSGGPSYTYETGPDNKRYAVGGEVSIDISPGRTPEETILKAQRIREAALAPANPSSQDHSVAAQASRMEGEARQQQQALQNEAKAESTQPYSKAQRDPDATSNVGRYLNLFA